MACSRMIVIFYLTGEYWESQNCNPPLLMDFSGPEFRTVRMIIIQLYIHVTVHRNRFLFK